MSRSLFYKKIIFIFFINFHNINFCHNQVNSRPERTSSQEYCFTDTRECITSCNPAIKTLFLPLSTAQNLYTQYHKAKYEEFDVSLTYRFQQASNNNDIGLSLLGRNPLLFVGLIDGNTDDTGRPKDALIPEYFGLASDTNTSLYLTPQVRNQILDLQMSFQGENFWTQVNIPLVKGQWKINNIPIINNTNVGINPLEPQAQTYIYNIGQTFNAYPDPAPPSAPENNIPNNYNILPIIPAITPTAPVPPNYTGAYIISSIDASDGDSYIGVSAFNSSDQNTGSIDFSNSIYNEGFTGNNELNANNWKLDIGSWPLIYYDGMIYEAATTPTTPPPAINSATLNYLGTYDLTGDVTDVSNINGQQANTLQITQNQLNPATTFEQALSGEYNFNQLLNRLYNNLNFNKDCATEAWGIADIILWFGYDFCRTTNKHIGFYIHGVIPTGTNITQEWYRNTLSPVIGNGHHYQLGIGLSGRYLFCTRNTFTLTCNIDGYVDHVFAANQFRVFDKINNPMSRYAIIKSLQYTGGSNDNIFNDDYEYQNINILGNINNANLMVSNNFKGEFIIDLVMKNNCVETGFGYAFSGLSGDVINCNMLPVQNTQSLSNINETYYGYKGNTAISNLIVMNITSGEENFNPTLDPLTACPNSTTVACNYPVAANFNTAISPIIQPQGNTILIKSCGDVTIGGNSGAYLYGDTSGQDSNGNDYSGTVADDVFILPDIKNNQSGLMNGQILNRIFGHVEYNWDTLYTPTIGIVGSYGFGSKNYFTAFYWDLGFYIGCSF